MTFIECQLLPQICRGCLLPGQQRFHFSGEFTALLFQLAAPATEAVQPWSIEHDDDDDGSQRTRLASPAP